MPSAISPLVGAVLAGAEGEALVLVAGPGPWVAGVVCGPVGPGPVESVPVGSGPVGPVGPVEGSVLGPVVGCVVGPVVGSVLGSGVFLTTVSGSPAAPA
ncbi:hypothetical protein B0E38_07549 [Streptomyces sp. 111WW2]|nr:hypothetical protein B0E38_07549 [Streptomyces sp. 111WW2]